MLASIRPDSINFALLVHVLGAMVMVGALVTAVAAALVGWRDETGALSRLSYKTLLYAALPGYIVMRVGAEWVYAKEHLDDLPEDPAWVGIGFITSDLGGSCCSSPSSSAGSGSGAAAPAGAVGC